MAGTHVPALLRHSSSESWQSRGAGRYARYGVLAGILALVLAGPMSAQMVRGRVVDEGTLTPVVGAHVSVVDTAGGVRASVLTNEQGRFQVRVAGPGRYRLRVEMIGRAGTTTAAIALEANGVHEAVLELPLAPVSLPGLEVRSGQRCELRSVASSEVVTVWEEARKSLAVEAAVREQRIYRFDLVRFERQYDATLTRVTRENTRHMSRVTGDPFVSVPAERLAREGYRERRGEEWYLHGPTGEVLLSQSFLDTHCFYLRRDRGGAGRIGLAFEPVPERTLTDIEGVLWLDERSAELRTLEFRYTRMPATLAPGTYGGNVEFQRLPNGAIIVRKWEIYSPIVNRNRQIFNDNRVGGDRVVGRFVDGGEVLNIFVREGHILDTTPRATLAGVVWDSTAGAPAAGAEVFLAGTEVAGGTDARGRFRLAGLPAGRYGVAFRYTSRDSITFEIAPRVIALSSGATAEIALGTPRLPVGLTPQEIARRDSISAVSRVALGRRDADVLLRQAADSLVLGSIAGEVTDETTRRPIAGTRVFVRGALLGDATISVVSDARGRFRRLDLRPGDYELVAQHADYALHVSAMTVKAGEALEIDVQLVRPDAGGQG